MGLVPKAPVAILMAKTAQGAGVRPEVCFHVGMDIAICVACKIK